MSAERLFRILGLVDEDLVAEASAAREKAAPPPAGALRKKAVWPWKRLAAAAACFTLVCTFGFLYLVTGGFQGMGSSAPSTSSSDSAASDDAGTGGTAGSPEESEATADGNFSSYAGPVLPLTTAE